MLRLLCREAAFCLILSTFLGVPAFAQEALSLAEGKWRVITDGAVSCSDPEVNPHTIRFTPDRQTAIFETDRPFKGAGGSMTNTYSYRVLGSSGNSIRMALTTETQKTESGELVVWIFLLIDKDTYTWSRTDWQRGMVTRGRWARC